MIASKNKWQGFSLFEVLIALSIVTIALLGLGRWFTLAYQGASETQYQAMAWQQLANMAEDTLQGDAMGQTQWNQANKRLLPQGQGRYWETPEESGVSITWLSTINKSDSLNEMALSLPGNK